MFVDIQCDSGAAFARYHPGLRAVGRGRGLYLPDSGFLLRLRGDHLAAVLLPAQYPQGGRGHKVYDDSFGYLHVDIPHRMQRGICRASEYGSVRDMGSYGGGLAVSGNLLYGPV